MESQKAMATETGDHPRAPRATRTATTVSSFSRSSSSSLAAPQTPTNPGVKLGPNGAAFVSSGIPDLDRILGGGFLLGSLVMIMEDADAPHHLLLLRNFMSQGVVHRQPVLFASPLRDPRAFLGTLPSPISSSKEQSIRLKAASPDQQGQEKDLRIAWQYKKYFGDQQSSQISSRDVKQEFSNDFDLRKPLERKAVQYIDCVSIQDTPDLAILRDQCSNFLSSLPRSDGSTMVAGRIAVQSFCAPQCGYSEMDWDMVAFIRFLRSMTRSANAVAVVTFPSSYLRPSFLKRWEHLADTLLAVRAIPDEDKDLAKLLTGYQDMLGLLHVHKVAQMNTQLSEFVEANLKLAGRDCVIFLVPTVLEASTFSIKLYKRRSLVLERLNQAPVEASSGTSYSTTSSCSGPSHGSSLDF